MQTLESGQDKIKEITERLRKDTLEPAQKEADRLVKEAKERAAKIVAEGEAKAKELEVKAKAAIEKERAVFETALKQAGKQAVEALKQEIEERLFEKQLARRVAEASGKSDVVASVINALVKAVEKEGSGASLSAAVGKGAKVEEVTQLLLADVREVLKGGITVGEFAGGARLSLAEQQLTLDMSDEAVLELLQRYVRKDFRKALFG
ncbi:MAG: V-type ATP synthase subunit E [Candidatus Obscuribacterales bacterium]